MRPTPIHFSAASIPPVTMHRILQGKLLDPRSEGQRRYIPIESINTYPSPKHEYESDSDLEDDGGEWPEQSKPHDTGNFGKL